MFSVFKEEWSVFDFNFCIVLRINGDNKGMLFVICVKCFIVFKMIVVDVFINEFVCLVIMILFGNLMVIIVEGFFVGFCVWILFV